MTSQTQEPPEKETDELWKRRVNRAADVYYDTCRKIASALTRLRRKK